MCHLFEQFLHKQCYNCWCHNVYEDRGGFESHSTYAVMCAHPFNKSKYLFVIQEDVYERGPEIIGGHTLVK